MDIGRMREWNGDRAREYGNLGGCGMDTGSGVWKNGGMGEWNIEVGVRGIM